MNACTLIVSINLNLVGASGGGVAVDGVTSTDAGACADALGINDNNNRSFLRTVMTVRIMPVPYKVAIMVLWWNCFSCT